MGLEEEDADTKVRAFEDLHASSRGICHEGVIVPLLCSKGGFDIQVLSCDRTHLGYSKWKKVGGENGRGKEVGGGM